MLFDFGFELFPVDGDCNHLGPEGQLGHTI